MPLPTRATIADFACRLYPIGTDAHTARIKADEKGGVFELHTERGEFIFKYSQDGIRLKNEAEILARLAPLEVAPTLVRTKRGSRFTDFEGCKALLYRKVAGQVFSYTPSLMPKMGLLLGKIHQASTKDYLYAELTLGRAARAWIGFYSLLKEPQPEGEREAMQERLRRIPRFPDLPLALVHGDPHPGNFVKTNEGKYMVIDFELGRLAPRLYDLGYVLTSLGTISPLPISKLSAARAFLDAYLKRQPLSDAELEALPFVMDLHLASYAIDWKTRQILPGNIKRYLAWKKRLAPTLEKLASVKKSGRGA
jgi:Ser/Thr protein kinase RdoA (MazF antagonist)